MLPSFRALLFLVAVSSLAGPVRVVSTLSGDGISGYSAANVAQARWNYPYSACSDLLGNIYVADTENQVIRVVRPDGTVRIVAGRLNSRGTEDGGPNVARFNSPLGIACGGDRSLYIADTGNHSIRRIDSSGNVSTVAGKTGVNGSSDGVATKARFSSPAAVAIDGSGTLYVADTSNHVIRTVAPDGYVKTLAGHARVAGSADGFATAAEFAFPFGLAFTPNGELLVADSGNHTIRAVTVSGAVRTLYGVAGLRGAIDGDGATARFARPTGLAADAAGNVLVADTDNNRIRLISKGIVSTLAGSAKSCFVDGDVSTACFDHPVGVAIAGSRVVVLDTYNQSIRLVDSRAGRRRGVRP